MTVGRGRGKHPRVSLVGCELMEGPSQVPPQVHELGLRFLIGGLQSCQMGSLSS